MVFSGYEIFSNKNLANALFARFNIIIVWKFFKF